MTYQLVKPTELATLEDYAASLMLTLGSIRTIEQYQLQAFKKGILSDDEMETAKTICWELQRLIALHRAQFKNLSDRVDLDQAKIVADFKAANPDLKVKKVRRKKSEAERI